MSQVSETPADVKIETESQEHAAAAGRATANSKKTEINLEGLVPTIRRRIQSAKNNN